LYSLEVVEKVDKIFKKLQKEDTVQFEALTIKVNEILENPHQFKPLKTPMQHMRESMWVHLSLSTILMKS